VDAAGDATEGKLAAELAIEGNVSGLHHVKEGLIP
jgi:hypothetical protein